MLNQMRLSEKKRLTYCYNAEFLDDENVLLISETDKTLLSGRLYNLILKKIQQNDISVNELIENLENAYSIFEIYHAINILEKEGFITETAPLSMPREVCAYWNSQGIEVNSLLSVLQDKTVEIQTIGSLTKDVFFRAFDEIGLKRDETGVLKLVITDDYERKELRKINIEAIRTKQPWLLAKPVGAELWMGPLFIPGKTGCWECLKQRLSINNIVNTVYKTQKNSEDNPEIPLAALPLSLQMAANLLSIEIVKWLYFNKNKRLEGQIITFDTTSLESRSHTLTKRPQCKTCGEPGYKISKPEPVVLRKSSSCLATYAGGYREMSPEDTLEKHQHHVSPITGMVQKLMPYHIIEGAPLYNYSSGDNMAFMSKKLFWLNNHIRAGNGGKGSTISQAKVGALCEGIERYGLTYHGDEFYIVSSLNRLGNDGIHPNLCMNFSEKQYQIRDSFNSTCTKFYLRTPVPFDESLETHWSPAYSLTEQKFKYLPSSLCYAHYPTEDDERVFAYPDSNGCAAGNSLEEAILQGFLELVERDSVAIWWYNRLKKPAVDFQSFNVPYFDQLTRFYRFLNRSLYVLDITSDLQIPSFAAISHRLDDTEKQDIIFGYGAHVDTKIAVERALIELNQILPIANVPEKERQQGKYLTKDTYFRDWLNSATMENQPYLVPLKETPEKKASDYIKLCKPDIYDSLVFCIERAKEHGLETLVLDMTRPDMELKVVKVFVPTMRHFWKRLAPGRLYDIPVRMGWLDAPLKEEELNPIGIFI